MFFKPFSFPQVFPQVMWKTSNCIVKNPYSYWGATMRRLWNNYLNLLFLTPHVYSSVIVSSMMNESMNMVGIIRMTKHLVDHYHHVLTGIVHQVYHEVHDSMVDC